MRAPGRMDVTSGGSSLPDEIGDTAAPRRGLNDPPPYIGRAVVYYENNSGWRGYWDTDGNGGLVFHRIARYDGAYGTDATELAQMRNDAPPARQAPAPKFGYRYTAGRVARHQRILDALDECGGSGSVSDILRTELDLPRRDSLKTALLELYNRGHVSRVKRPPNGSSGLAGFIYTTTGKPLPTATLTCNEAKGVKYRAQIIDYLCQSEHVTVTEVAEHVGCCPKRARVHLHALADEGMVEFTDGGVRNYWWIT